MHSHALTCPHMHSHALTCPHMHSHALTCTHMHSNALTCTHMHSHALTCPHMHSHALTCTPLWAPSCVKHNWFRSVLFLVCCFRYVFCLLQVCLEYMGLGDLRGYLRKSRGIGENGELTEMTDDEHPFQVNCCFFCYYCCYYCCCSSMVWP